MKKIVLIIILGIVLIGAIVGWRLYTKPVEGFAGAEAAHSLPSTELYMAFSDNESSAMSTYAGEVVEVRGLVVDRMENSDGGTTLVLEGGHPIFGVKCRLDPQLASADLPQKNETTTLRGLCVGMNSDVELDRCVIVSPEKP